MSEIEHDMGTIGIRVVVFRKKVAKTSTDQANEMADLEETEDFSNDTEVGTFLESPSKGKLCCVFLINGQRHHGVDNSMIVHELKMKYLRKRMIIVVDLDGLSQRATSEIMQGSRGSFYEGEVYQKIRDRISATLKNDPQLLQLEEEAEEELSQLKAGDAVVQQALDQLIEHHFDAGDHSNRGDNLAGEKEGALFGQDGKPASTKVVVFGDSGEVAQNPALVSTIRSNTLRCYPGEKFRFKSLSFPEVEFANLKQITHELTAPIEGLTCNLNREDGFAEVELEFTETENFDTTAYPLETDLRITAIFEGQPEPRLLEKRIVIKPRAGVRPPPPPRALLDTPTYLKVSSHQPVRLIAGGADTHVRLVWDGKDSLTFEPTPEWTFKAQCHSHVGLEALTFTKPTNGRFEVLVSAPEDLLLGTKLEFEVTGMGPESATLSAKFNAEIVAPPGARQETKELSVTGQRRPPYKLIIIDKNDWNTNTRWGESGWDQNHSACFVEPKTDHPLRLIINSDYSLFKGYQDEQIAKRADEKRLEEKKTKYVSHVAYHLYQMYLAKTEQAKAKSEASTVEASQEVEAKPPSDDEQQAEINRVASTILRLMEVMR